MATPKVISALVSECSFDVEYPLLELVSILQKENTRLLKEGWTDLNLSLEEDQYSDRRYVFMRGKRMETEAEAIRRETQEQIQKDLREQRDRADFERLKAKFQ